MQKWLFPKFYSNQSTLDPSAYQAQQIANLWWIFFYVCLTVFVIVMMLALIAVFRKRNRSEEGSLPVIIPSEQTERHLTRVVAGAVVLTAVIQFSLLVKDFFVNESLNTISDKQPVTIKLIGHQWWWEVQYQDQSPANLVTTANELYVPVGKAVRFMLDSRDVIHSFWIPNMNGKKDLIPGHPTTTWFQAEHRGDYQGQCAEFCGAQHAHMRLVIHAVSQKDFYDWLNRMRKPAPQPGTPSEKMGEQVFLSSQCMMCHTISGTKARSTVGPDLTHIASRKMIAAGSFPNTRGYLAGWILDPQNLKPGAQMPPNPLPPEQLTALLDYLQTLR